MRKLKFNYLTASLRARPQCILHICCLSFMSFLLVSFISVFVLQFQADKKLKKYRRMHAASGDRQVYYSQHQLQITTNKICFHGLSLLLQCAAAAAASAFVSVTGYHISIINPFILLTFITRSNVVDDGDGGVWLSGWICMGMRVCIAYFSVWLKFCAHVWMHFFACA